jgi:hypothetical protein
MKVRIEFEITDNMAWHCIEHLLNAEITPTKKKVIDLCRNRLEGTGNLFQTEYIFDYVPEYRQVSANVVDKWFEKIWK